MPRLPPTTGRRSWLLDADRTAWDEQICLDFSEGGAGMKLLSDIDEQIRALAFRVDFRPE